jgi:hypothetical protein
VHKWFIARSVCTSVYVVTTSLLKAADISALLDYTDAADGCRRSSRNVSTCLPIYTASHGSAILAVLPKECRAVSSVV